MLIITVARLLTVLSNVRLTPTAANALITAIGLVATAGGPVDDLNVSPSTPVSTSPPGSVPGPVSSASAPGPLPVLPPIYQDAPDTAAPGQPDRFHVPGPNQSQAPYFAVSRGLAVGVFSGW